MTLASQVLKNSKDGGLQMFWVVWPGVELIPLLRFFLMSSQSSGDHLLVSNHLLQPESVWLETGQWVICAHSYEKDQQAQCLWNRAENSHYFYCMQDLILYPETLSRSELIPTALCLLGLREEPVGDVMQRNWTKERAKEGLNVYLCKFFPCQFRQLLLTIHSIMLSTH